MTTREQLALLREMEGRTPEEIDVMVKTGAFNTIIKGYARIAMRDSGFSPQEIARLNFEAVFNKYNLKEVRKNGNF